MIGCPFHPDDAPPSAHPAGERPCRPEEGAVGADAALRKGQLAAQQAGGAEEAAAAATAAAAGAPVPRSPGSLTGDFGRSERGRRRQRHVQFFFNFQTFREF